MVAASRYGSMMLARAAARPSFAAPLAIRPFSTTPAGLQQKGSGDRPVRSNPLVGNFVPPKPSQPPADEPAPISTEKPRSSQPPSPDRAPASSAEVPPNADMPPPPPPPPSASAQTPSYSASNTLEKVKANRTQPPPPSPFSYDAAKPFSADNMLDIGNIVRNSAQEFAKDLENNPQNQNRVRTASVTGRTVFLEGPFRNQFHPVAYSAEKAFMELNRSVSRYQIKRLWHRQRFHERPGLKRKRQKSERWRKRFKKGFEATCERTMELKRQGW